MMVDLFIRKTAAQLIFCNVEQMFLKQIQSDLTMKCSDISDNLFSLIRCCCGRLMGEHSWQESFPPISLYPSPEQGMEEWSMEAHTKATSTNAYGIIDFQDTATRVCRAKVCKSINCGFLCQHLLNLHYVKK